MNIDDIRNSTVSLYNLQNTDDTYTIYYDESNNIRKLRLNAEGLNIGQPVCFALAGIFHRGAPKPINFDQFRAAARIHKSVPEVKIGTLVSGDFLRCMGSQKIENFLDWMRTEGLLVHYQSTDVLYWSIVDIIDSIYSGSIIGRRMDVDLRVKNSLYEVLRADLPAATSLLYEFDYPNVGQARRVEFLNALIARVEKQRMLIPAHLHALLLGVLRDGRELPRLPFLEGEAAGELIESFRHFYVDRIALFNNSQHIFDNETKIEEALTLDCLHSAGQPLTNYRFADSKDEPGVQASDVVAGIMSKLFNYAMRTPKHQISKDLRTANPRQVRNIDSLRALVETSIDVSAGFAHTIMSLEDQQRAGIILN